jgi:hypothetical protein
MSDKGKDEDRDFTREEIEEVQNLIDSVLDWIKTASFIKVFAAGALCSFPLYILSMFIETFASISAFMQGVEEVEPGLMGTLLIYAYVSLFVFIWMYRLKIIEEWRPAFFLGFELTSHTVMIISLSSVSFAAYSALWAGLVIGAFAMFIAMTIKLNKRKREKGD